jgi:hypothetical protein
MILSYIQVSRLRTETTVTMFIHADLVYYAFHNTWNDNWAFTESEENNDGEDRLRFYLKDSNNNDSKPDSIALTVKDGQQRIVIDASNIETIELSQKTGHFKFNINGNYKVRSPESYTFYAVESMVKVIRYLECKTEFTFIQIEKLENANFVECKDDPTEGQLLSTKSFECYVDKKNPITMARETEPNIKNWSSESSRFREILHVLDADAVSDFLILL